MEDRVAGKHGKCASEKAAGAETPTTVLPVMTATETNRPPRENRNDGRTTEAAPTRKDTDGFDAKRVARDDVDDTTVWQAVRWSA